MSLSRRTWLWTSTAALAAACTRPGPTKLPQGEGGVARAEGPRPLTRRGAENLIALAELGAAIRWLHPSDQARQIEWEALVLDGVRSLEAAGTRTELVEGLRGLFGEVAPTVVVWRSAAQREGEELDEPACLDPEAEAKESGEEIPDDAAAEPDDAAAKSETPESRAREATHGNGRPPAERPKPPVRTAPGGPSDRQQAEASAESEQAEPEATPAGELEGTSSEPEGEAAASESAKGETKEPEQPDAEADEGKTDEEADEEDGKDEPPPPLPEALFGADESLTITQWFRRGYADGLDDDPGCAVRVEHDPKLEPSCAVHPRRRKRRRPAGACAGCDAIEAAPLAPAAPLRVELPRGLSSLIPLGLWTRAGQTLPATAKADAAPAFGELEAFDYSLEDRGTRLLVVLRVWSLVRRFFPRASGDPRGLLLPALCAAAEDPSPLGLRSTVETMLAGFGDGNAALILETGRAARRYVPELSLAWVEQRVVVASSALEQARPGDVITKIDGVSIDTVLAEQLARTPAATASAGIVRTVARLLERDQKRATIELELLREGERELVAKVIADQRSDRAKQLADARPSKPIVELERGCVYVDATRVGNLAHAARRARKAARLIVDLRGELGDPRRSLVARFIDTPTVIALERMPTGPDPSGELPLELAAERRIEPDGPRLSARVIVLSDARTRGRAELELAGFDQLGATVIGSASAGDLGGVATAWLPGGWRLAFTHSELHRPDGTRLSGTGIRPTLPVEPSLASLRESRDLLIAAALSES